MYETTHPLLPDNGFSFPCSYAGTYDSGRYGNYPGHFLRDIQIGKMQRMGVYHQPKTERDSFKNAVV